MNSKLTFVVLAGLLLALLATVAKKLGDVAPPVGSNAPNAPAGMAYIPPGNYWMGDSMHDDVGSKGPLRDAIIGVFDKGRSPRHQVYVSAFYMDKYEVTGVLWNEVRTWAVTNNYTFGAGSCKATNHPIHHVSWYDAVKWCNARSQMDGLTPCYYTDANQTVIYKTGEFNTAYVKWTANGYRLPTEAEWEKSARGGLDGKRFPWGDTISHSQANYNGDTGGFAYDLGPNGLNPIGSIGGTVPATSPVGSFAANGYGLYDMAGNVWEWCWDWHDDEWYSKRDATQNDTRGPTGPLFERVLRGGNWANNAFSARCAYRPYSKPSNADYSIGFRCVRGL